MLKLIKRFFNHFPRLIHLKLLLTNKWEIAKNVFMIYKLLKKIEYYQPLYNFNIFSKKNPQRKCIDRADTIYKEIVSWGNNSRILDIGCSLGYFSFFFAERNFLVNGVDYHSDNIKLCNSLKCFNSKNATFSTENFSESYINNLNCMQYDIAFIFSVLHHIIHEKGLYYVKNLINKLLDKIPVLFVELAVSREEVSTVWINSLPENELAIFDLERVDITLMGYFPTHLSSVLRRLYMVKNKVISLGGIACNFVGFRTLAYEKAPNLCRKYYDCGDIFVKQYLLDNDINNLENIIREIGVYNSLPKNSYIPTLINHKINHKTVEMFFLKYPGYPLFDWFIKGKKVLNHEIFKSLIESLSFLLDQGLYHNDIRLWNILFDGKKSYLIDLSEANSYEVESTKISLQWIIKEMHYFTCYRMLYPICEAPKFDISILSDEFKFFYQLLSSSRDLRVIFDNILNYDCINV